jgi:hypothetical protein
MSMVRGNHLFIVDARASADAFRRSLSVRNAGYSTDVITDRSVDFIKRHKEQPFFLYVAHQTPHNPCQTGR